MTEKAVEGLSFEEAMAELERVVGQLESGNVDLEKSIALYERGAALKAHCEKKLNDAQEKVAAARVLKAVDTATAAGVKASGHTVEAVHPWEAIIEHAKSRGCDLIVMASHGRRGLSALLLGSETQKVLTHTDLPVLVVR
jgi:exodeoxyribonuclease VII small subunit